MNFNLTWVDGVAVLAAPIAAVCGYAVLGTGRAKVSSNVGGGTVITSYLPPEATEATEYIIVGGGNGAQGSAYTIHEFNSEGTFSVTDQPVGKTE